MQLSIKQLDFSIAINSCHDEILNKMQHLTSMQIDLLNKYENQIIKTEIHYQLIHDIRIMIVNLQEMHKDVKQYFNQIGVSFIYQFFRKIHHIMIYGYNFLSQALITNVEKISKNQDDDNNNKIAHLNPNYLNISTTTNSKQRLQKKQQCSYCNHSGGQNANNNTQNKQNGNLPHPNYSREDSTKYDFKISVLQRQEQKLAQQIEVIYDKMMKQKSLIEKTKPSLVVRELEDMRENIENIIEYTNSVFEESYMIKYFEFKNSLQQLKKPEDFVSFFISNMNETMKAKFFESMSKIIKVTKFNENKDKYLNRQYISTEVQTQKWKQLRHAIRLDKTITLPLRQEKVNEKALLEFQINQKQVSQLLNENQDLKKQLKKIINDKDQLQLNYQTLQELYRKKSYQFELHQTEKQWKMSQQQSELFKLKVELKHLKRNQIVTQHKLIQVTPETCNVCLGTENEMFYQAELQNQIIGILKKNNEKLIIKLNQKEKKIKQYKQKLGNVDIEELKINKTLFQNFIQELFQLTDLNVNKPFVKVNQQQNKNVQENQIMMTKIKEEISFLVKNKFTRANQQRRSTMIKRISVKNSFMSPLNVRNQENKKNSQNNKNNNAQNYSIFTQKNKKVLNSSKKNIKTISPSQTKNQMSNVKKPSIKFLLNDKNEQHSKNKYQDKSLVELNENQEDNKYDQTTKNKYRKQKTQKKRKPVIKKIKVYKNNHTMTNYQSNSNSNSNDSQDKDDNDNQNDNDYNEDSNEDSNDDYNDEDCSVLDQIDENEYLRKILNTNSEMSSNEFSEQGISVQIQTDLTSKQMQLFGVLLKNSYKNSFLKDKKYQLNNLRLNNMKNKNNLSFNHNKYNNNKFDFTTEQLFMMLSQIQEQNVNQQNKSRLLENCEKLGANKQNILSFKKNQTSSNVSYISMITESEKHNSFKPSQYIRQFTQTNQSNHIEQINHVKKTITDSIQNQPQLYVKAINKKLQKINQEQKDSDSMKKNSDKLIEIIKKTPIKRQTQRNFLQNKYVLPDERNTKYQQFILQPCSKQSYQRYSRNTYSERKRTQRSP